MGNPHSLRLIDVHHPRRSDTEERFQQTRTSLVTIEKDKILNNNIQEIGEETQFYAWAGLDLTDKDSREQRLDKLEPLLELFLRNIF